MTRKEATANTNPIDAARGDLVLSDLRLPAIRLAWPALAERADKEGWPAARFLAALVEHEIVERGRRRVERHLDEARLPPGKTLASFDFDATPNAHDIELKGESLLLIRHRHSQRGDEESDLSAWIRLYVAAALRPPRSEPQNSHDLLPKAMLRSALSAALSERQNRPSSRDSANATQRYSMGRPYRSRGCARG